MSSLRSECALRSLGLFGLTTDDASRHDQDLASRTAARAAGIHRSLRAGQLALIVGPSAAGKSSMLRDLARYPSSLSPVRAQSEDAHAAVIDSLAPSPADLPCALRALSAAGLADAFLPARRISHLSEGERARLTIARAILAAEHLLTTGASPTILLDDFADNLDHATAASVAFTLRRWLAHHPRARIILATLRPYIAAHLRPDLTLDLGLRTPDLRAGNPLSFPPQLTITAGTLADYDTLAHHHYRAGRPATIAAVLVARFTRDREESRSGEPSYPEQPAAVLTISMPTLNGAWRPRAWPDLASSRGSKRVAARELNRSLRCISRIIVHPHHRARGLGSDLIRHYLADPLTPRTEALSAMGAISPIFTRAGMTEWMLPPAPRDLKLIDALSAADLRPWMLADIDLALERIDRFPHMDRALRIWATAHGPTRPLAHAPPRDLIGAAAKHIITPRRAYTHG
jgi:ABC-type cobalamin/Fe3+-siderophores transport system ATPase subunit/GNAT superfamily N-acetyltransferase